VETKRERIVWIGLVVALMVAIVVIELRPPRLPNTSSVMIQFSVLPPEQTSFPTNFVLDPSVPAVSPDGRFIAFIAYDDSNHSKLWLRSTHAGMARPIDGTENARMPFWSPDSQYIAFFAAGKLKKVAPTGKSVEIICQSCWGSAGTWGEDVIVYAAPDTSSLFQVDPNGGDPAILSSPRHEKGETAQMFPRFLPDGRTYLVGVSNRTPRTTALHLRSLDSRESIPILDSVISAQYVSPGYLLFLRPNGTLWSQEFDLRSFSLKGESHEVANNATGFSASASNLLAFRTNRSKEGKLTWFDRSGQVIGTLDEPALYGAPSISPAGQVLYTKVAGNNADIWISETAQQGARRLTTAVGSENCPVWSPDGRRLAFSANRTGRYDIYQRNADGTGGDEMLLDNVGENGALVSSWGSDSGSLLFFKNAIKTGWDVAALNVLSKQWTAVLETRANEFHAVLSPDGHWMAYTSDESGMNEVYVRRYPSAERSDRISNGGGGRAKWRKDGKELFYITDSGDLMSVPVANDGSPALQRTAKLFKVDLADVGTGANCTPYDVTPDGMRFLVAISAEDVSKTPFTVIVNWMSAAPATTGPH
jgi:eukaryotic-like serine/threonine-protein kinase